jgi:EAL domain-containing protein (putative c-di-GMP-specific phosphodiesterase class I)/GGDEF domain-containing protein
VSDSSLHDPDSGLATPALLREHLALAIARGRDHDHRVALIHLGLEGLDLVSDALGDDSARSVFAEVSARAAAAVRRTDVVAVPASGELAVLLADLDGQAVATADAVAGQLFGAVRGPFMIGGHEFDLGARAGVSLLPGDAPDAEGLVRHARAALHQACEQDGERVVFYAGGTSDALERLLLTARLRRALERDEFVLHYQPIFHLADGALIAFEALLRWEDPDRGQIPPLSFLSAAETSGLIEPIGSWVLDAACAQARNWSDAGMAVPIAVNVSLREFRNPDFADNCARRIAAHGIDPGLLVLEITESAAMRDPDCVEPVLAALRATGIAVAIDDFGTGYSSLGRLRDIAVDALKLDRSFLVGAPDDPAAARLASASLALVDALGLQAVAEGVETEAQRAFLVEHGCPQAQGFHLGRPEPAAAAGARLRDRLVS